MKKNTIVTDQMKYDYSIKVIFRLYMQKLITESEYKEIETRLKQYYKIQSTATESNEIDMKWLAIHCFLSDVYVVTNGGNLYAK